MTRKTIHQAMQESYPEDLAYDLYMTWQEGEYTAEERRDTLEDTEALLQDNLGLLWRFRATLRTYEQEA